MKTVSIFIAGSTVQQAQRVNLKALAIDLNGEFEKKGGSCRFSPMKVPKTTKRLTMTLLLHEPTSFCLSSTVRSGQRPATSSPYNSPFLNVLDLLD